MSTPSHARAEPVRPHERDDRSRRSEAPKVGAPLRILTLCLGSLAVMAPWPLLGIMLTHPYFDRSSEAFMLFGGVILFPLVALAIFGSPPEEVLIATLMLVWLATAVVPYLWLRRHLNSWLIISVLLGSQTVISLAQAVMGALLVVGKNI